MLDRDGLRRKRPGERGEQNENQRWELHERDYIGQNPSLMSTARRIVGALVFYGRFAASFSQVGYRARRAFWPTFTPDFRGQHWLVTGGSGGLGRQMVWAALQGGARVTAAARSPEKLAALAAEASAAGLVGLEIECCDFTSLRETRQLVARLAAKDRPIDVLMNNVGVMNDALIVTPEGYEASFASNLLAHWALTESLIEHALLRRGSAVVNIASGGGYTVPLSTALLNVTTPEHFNGVMAYAAHKRAQISLTAYWRERYHGKGVEFFVMHPGWVDTAGVQRALPKFRQIFSPVLRDAHSGADTAIWLAASRPDQPSGELIWLDRKVRPAHMFSYTRTNHETPEQLANFLRNRAAVCAL